MIRISGSLVEIDPLLNKYTAAKIETEIIKTLHSSSTLYDYDSMKEFAFELTLRNSIVKASKDLAKTKFTFKAFKEAYCNSDYWKLTSAGGFLLKTGVKSSTAILDIYSNSSKYATECATAIVIVYFKALVDVLSEKLFLKLFPDIYLYSWMHLDPDLGIYDFENPPDFLPGDCRYFMNPEHDVDKPEWQGENAIDLGNRDFYGHGIGIASDKQIIKELNSLRKHGSKTSAYLMNSAKRPNFKHLAKS